MNPARSMFETIGPLPGRFNLPSITADRLIAVLIQHLVFSKSELVQ
jgi:hypothetical protein